MKKVKVNSVFLEMGSIAAMAFMAWIFLIIFG
jgi:hypothetical protein